MADLDQESDESLMGRVQRGDHQAFSGLVTRHTNMFYAAAYRMCGHEQEAEDIVQDAFLKLWNKPEVWNENKGAKFTTWFYRVVTNQALDYMRRRKKTAGSEALDLMPDENLRADEVLAEKQEGYEVERAIQALSDRQKVALNLCFYEGLSNKDAAKVMGVGVKALESLLMRAKQGLKDELLRSGVLTEEKGRRYG